MVREASAETAYAAGEYAHALQEYRALRRMTGDQAYLPVIADCERALGRPHDALVLIREAAGLSLPGDTRVELILVEAGARGDLGQTEESHRLLRDALRTGVPGASSLAQARLAYAFAEALLTRGRDAQARTWFARAADWDAENQTDAADRRDQLDGLHLEYDDTEDFEVDDEDESLDDPETPAAPVESDVPSSPVDPDVASSLVEQDRSGPVSKPGEDTAEASPTPSDPDPIPRTEQDQA